MKTFILDFLEIVDKNLNNNSSLSIIIIIKIHRVPMFSRKHFMCVISFNLFFKKVFKNVCILKRERERGCAWG